MTFDLFDFEEATDLCPERILWLAVIERAIMDYCFPALSLQKKDVRDLDWFLFSPVAQEFNVTYICSYLFDNEDAAKMIRKRVAALKNSSLAKDKFEKSRYRITSLCAFQLSSKPETRYTAKRRLQLAQAHELNCRHQIQKLQQPIDYLQPELKGDE
jgi:hypothetical protein